MPESHRNRGGALKIVLIILGVVVAIMVGAGIFIATHWRGWAAQVANQAAIGMVRESGLPSVEQDEILAEVRRLTEDFEAGRISGEEVARMAKAVAEGPLIPLAGVQAAREKYIEPSNMSAEEKADAILSLQRLARGVSEKRIRTDEITDVVKPIADLKANGRWDLKDNPTRLELDQFIQNAKARADDAGIPQEPFELNIADELRNAIHSADGWTQ